MSTTIRIINEHAASLRAKVAQIKEAVEKKHASHAELCRVFHAAYDSLAFPGGLKVSLAKLKQGDSEVIEVAILFLEADPRFFRSGYIKEELLRRLKHLPLTDLQRRRLALLVIRSLGSGGRREFRGYARLARILNRPEVTRAAVSQLDSPDAEVQRRATHLMQLIRHQGPDDA